jgi:hypothetical protein
MQRVPLHPGALGQPVAARLLERGFPLVVAPSSGSTGARADALVARGAAVARGVRHGAEVGLYNACTRLVSTIACMPDLSGFYLARTASADLLLLTLSATAV